MAPSRRGAPRTLVKGELVITQPYPYLARTLWGDAENLFEDSWRGDINRFSGVYVTAGTVNSFTQGDYARQHDDGAFTLRSF